MKNTTNNFYILTTAPIYLIWKIEINKESIILLFKKQAYIMAIELYSFSVNRDNCIQIINSINISIAVIIADIDGTPINTLPGTKCVEVAINWD